MKLLILLIISMTILIANPLSIDALPSPLKQIRDGILLDDILCRDGHVLVQRTNGKIACVTEKTALKTGWDIIQNKISPVEYEFPLSSKTFEKEFNNSEPKNWAADFEITISNLPKIGETAEVIVTVTNLMPFDMNEMFADTVIKISITDNFEFVDVSTDKIIKYSNIIYYKESLTVKSNETQTLSATVKAVKSGMGYVSGSANDYSSTFRVFVDESETLLRDDYYKLHPQVQLNVVEEQCSDTGPCEEPEPNAPDQEKNDTVNSVETSEEELREDLRNDGATEEEIDEIIRKAFPDSNVSTQSFLPSLIIQADWRNGVTSVIQGKNILVSSNGIPENNYSDIPARNPHEVTEQTFQFKYPLFPEFVGDKIPTRPGPIGMTLHGAVFFNQFDRDRNDANTRERFDSCNGHANAGGIYHYHQISACFEDSESGHSEIFGFVFDGFPIYGFNGTSGVPPTDLDECNGHSDTGEYHYHATKEYPYLVGCFNGIKQ